MADAYANLSASTVVTPPSPATTGTTLTLGTGHGARFPVPPFWAIVCPATTAPDPTNSEIVRVTAMAGDQVTAMTRGGTPRTVIAGDRFAAVLTKEWLDSVLCSKLLPDAAGYPILGDAATTTPAVPAAGVTLFARSRGGRRMAAQIGPSGIDYSFQPALFSNTCGWMRPLGNSTTVSANGLAATAIGTATAANWANTSALASARRISYISAATAGASGGVKHNVLQWWRGNAAGLGGFHFIVRFGFASIPATRRWFVGMYGSTTSPSNADPSSFITMCGVGQDVGDTTVQFMHNDATGTAVKSTGSTSLASPAANEVWEVRIFAKPNGSSIQMSAERLIAGGLSEYDSAASVDLPANTAGLLPIVWANNGTTAAAIDPHLLGLYIETDL